VKESDLTAAQLERLALPIGKMMIHMKRVLERMDATGFPLNDPLREQFARAHAAVHGLRIHLHYVHWHTWTREYEALKAAGMPPIETDSPEPGCGRG
jgi:hypothetical protein